MSIITQSYSANMVHSGNIKQPKTQHGIAQQPGEDALFSSSPPGGTWRPPGGTRKFLAGTTRDLA